MSEERVTVTIDVEPRLLAEGLSDVIESHHYEVVPAGHSVSDVAIVGRGGTAGSRVVIELAASDEAIVHLPDRHVRHPIRGTDDLIRVIAEYA